MFERIFEKYRIPIIVILIGLILIGAGILITKSQIFDFGASTKVEVLDSENNNFDLVVEMAGAVENPGIYKLPDSARIEDALIAAGGISGDASREWIEKNINRAARLTDGQKIYIPKQTEVSSASNSVLGQSGSSGFTGLGSVLVNINTGSQEELEELPGIGPAYAQKIIEQRPYSSIEELLSKGVVKQKLFDDIKKLISVF